MRRILILGLVVAFLVSASPAQAETRAERILLPVYANVVLPRTLYALSGDLTNGLFGFVFHLTKKTGTFTLTPESGAPDFVEFDIFFYKELTDSTPTGYFIDCPPGEFQCSKTGAIPAGSNYAVVTMAIGFANGFRYVS